MSAHRGDLPIGICVPSARVGVCGLCGVCFEDGPMTQEGDGERGLSVLAAWVWCVLQRVPDVTRVIRLVQEIPADDESFVAVSHAVRHTKAC